MNNSSRESGQNFGEYAVLLALVAILIIGIGSIVGPEIGEVFSEIYIKMTLEESGSQSDPDLVDENETSQDQGGEVENKFKHVVEFFLNLPPDKLAVVSLAISFPLVILSYYILKLMPSLIKKIVLKFLSSL